MNVRGVLSWFLWFVLHILLKPASQMQAPLKRKTWCILKLTVFRSLFMENVLTYMLRFHGSLVWYVNCGSAFIIVPFAWHLKKTTYHIQAKLTRKQQDISGKTGRHHKRISWDGVNIILIILYHIFCKKQVAWLREKMSVYKLHFYYYI